MAKKPVRSVFYDLFPEDEATELEMRSLLLSRLKAWLAETGMTQGEAARVIGLSQARITEIKQGKINAFKLGLLVRLAVRAGLKPKLKLAV